jgi:hypothetical protein
VVPPSLPSSLPARPLVVAKGLFGLATYWATCLITYLVVMRCWFKHSCWGRPFMEVRSSGAGINWSPPSLPSFHLPHLMSSRDKNLTCNCTTTMYMYVDWRLAELVCCRCVCVCVVNPYLWNEDISSNLVSSGSCLYFDMALALYMYEGLLSILVNLITPRNLQYIWHFTRIWLMSAM